MELRKDGQFYRRTNSGYINIDYTADISCIATYVKFYLQVPVKEIIYKCFKVMELLIVTVEFWLVFLTLILYPQEYYQSCTLEPI